MPGPECSTKMSVERINGKVLCLNRYRNLSSEVKIILTDQANRWAQFQLCTQLSRCSRLKRASLRKAGQTSRPDSVWTFSKHQHPSWSSESPELHSCPWVSSHRPSFKCYSVELEKDTHSPGAVRLPLWI